MECPEIETEGCFGLRGMGGIAHWNLFLLSCSRHDSPTILRWAIARIYRLRTQTQKSRARGEVILRMLGHDLLGPTGDRSSLTVFLPALDRYILLA